MKTPKRTSIPSTRHLLLVPAFSLILGAAVAQSGSAGSTSSGSSQKNPSTTSGSTASGSTRATGSGYQSGTASADADAARDINSQTRSGSMTNNKLAWGDRRFVTKAADSGQAEVALAQLAVQNATNPEVRSYAQKIVDDHTKVNSELMTLATQKNVTLDKDTGKDRSYNRLSKKTGSEFDQEFVEHMIDEHEKDVKLFEKAATDAKDSELRAFASNHVGHLRDHLQQAMTLRQTVMPTGRTDDSSGRSSPTNGPTGSSTGRSTTSGSSTGTSGTTTPPR